MSDSPARSATTQPLDVHRLRATLDWLQLIAVLTLAVLVWLVPDGPIAWRSWCLVTTGLGCVLGLGQQFSSPSRPWTSPRWWRPVALYAAALIACGAAYLAHPSTAGAAALSDQLLFLGVVASVAQVRWPGRVLALILAMYCVIGLQVLGPVSVVIKMGRATHYKSLDQWGGYPEIGMLMSLGATACVAILFTSGRVAVRAAAGVLALGLAGTTLYMLSRSAALTMAAVVPWLALAAAWRWRSRLAMGMAAILIVGALGVGVRTGAAGWARFVAATQVTGQELDLRRDGWHAGTAMLRDHLWLGVGPGRYPDEHAKYSTVTDRAHAYNLVVHTGAELGLIGLAVSLAIWTRLAVRTLRAAGPSEIGLVAFAAHAMLLTFFVRSQSEHFLANLPSSLRMLLLLGFLFGLGEAVVRAPSERGRTPSRLC